MQVRFTELAKLEFDEARAWYRAIRPELGRSFSQEVHTATQRYAVRGDLVLVVAVSHQHRAPDYWADRSSDS
jgi:hypothetical protein